MSSFSKQEQLRHLIDEQQERVRRTFPTSRGDAILALTRARDWRYLAGHEAFSPQTQDVPPGTAYKDVSGWYKVLQICFGNVGEVPSTSPTDVEHRQVFPTAKAEDWAEQVLWECDRLAEGEQVLAYCESGFMRMQQGGERDFAAWVASKNMPTEWRERADLAWWTHALAKNNEPELRELHMEKASLARGVENFASGWQAGKSVYRTTRVLDDFYGKVGMWHVKRMACHLLYPEQTLIGGCTIELYRKALATLIGWALKHLDICSAYVEQNPAYTLRALLAPSLAEAEFCEELAKTLGVEVTVTRRVVNALCLTHENVFAHCSMADTPAPPLLRWDGEHLTWSITGLLSEPFLFLTRELKRRYSSEYHTAAHQREEVFRQDLYELFGDKRFVRSEGSVELRDVQGKLKTDVDALIFDRKTGALALFELKAQDPFAYSSQERNRQRDYFYNAEKQVLAWMQWLNRNGANALLTRLDYRLVKRLKAQKTYIFVLGRYLAHFFDGPELDRRAAWGTWAQVLRLVGEGFASSEEAQPIQALYNKLQRERPLSLTGMELHAGEIEIGERKIFVYPDFQAYKGG